MQTFEKLLLQLYALSTKTIKYSRVWSRAWEWIFSVVCEAK